MSNSLRFAIKYDGPALQTHQMDVRELAPALMALSDLIEAANHVIYPTGDDVRIQVRGTFKSGSFGIDLIAIQNIGQQILGLLSGKEATAAANLLTILGGLGILGGAGGGLITLIKFLKGHKPSTIIERGESVIYQTHSSEEITSLEVTRATHKLYQTRVVRQHLAVVLRPLRAEGIDTFATFQDEATQNVVLSSEVPWFMASASEPDIISDQTITNAALLIESAVFKEGNKWRFSDGSVSFYASITDQNFLDMVASGLVRFGKGDMLHVDFRRLQLMTETGLKTDYMIEKVHKHKLPPQSTMDI